ncbi:hypothetical protein Sjap_021642 [Stephania japonica]|uniref:Ribonuclease H1 N-terminal domain-containing protein n=1 Tax=Stephania japonica TaxID=461633 RepID=A0AAP0EMD2_9MAGN
MSGGGKKYAVYEGRNPGVYDTWREAEAQVRGYSGNCHQKVDSYGRADPKPYVVYEGAKPGVYPSWKDAHSQVSGYPGAHYQRADNFTDAANKWCDHKCSQTQAMADKNKYVVHKGRAPGMYNTWGETNDQVRGYPGNCHEKVDSNTGTPSGNKHYVVYDGAKPGVYDNWHDTHDQVSGYSGKQYEKAKSPEDAVNKWTDFKTYGATTTGQFSGTYPNKGN